MKSVTDCGHTFCLGCWEAQSSPRGCPHTLPQLGLGPHPASLISLAALSPFVISFPSQPFLLNVTVTAIQVSVLLPRPGVVILPEYLTSLSFRFCICKMGMISRADLPMWSP